MSNLRETWEQLVRPFPFDDIEIKCMSLSKDGSKALAAPYFNARAVMNRLDEVVGPENWGASYTPLITGKSTGFLCDLWVEIDGKRIVRQDAAECTDIESIKGGISDALKRAFSAMGSRFLYEVDLGWQPCETYNGSDGKPRFSKFTREALAAMRSRYYSAPATKAPQTGSNKPETPKYPGSGEYLRSLELTTGEVQEFKRACIASNQEWGAVALDAKAAGVKDYEDLLNAAKAVKV